jgi:hypothetical protein
LYAAAFKMSAPNGPGTETVVTVPSSISSRALIVRRSPCVPPSMRTISRPASRSVTFGAW